MTRKVELTITLEVEVEASFVDGAWEIEDIRKIVYRKSPLDKDWSITEVILTNPYMCDELANNYAQQEP